MSYNILTAKGNLNELKSISVRTREVKKSSDSISLMDLREEREEGNDEGSKTFRKKE